MLNKLCCLGFIKYNFSIIYLSNVTTISVEHSLQHCGKETYLKRLVLSDARKWTRLKAEKTINSFAGQSKHSVTVFSKCISVKL